MSMFTPGPWEWVKDTFNGGYSGIVGRDNKEVLFPNHRNDGDDREAWFEEFPSDADRNLIAAAPTMYEALQYIITYWNGSRNEIAMIDALEFMIGEAEKALAKADGESHE